MTDIIQSKKQLDEVSLKSYLFANGPASEDFFYYQEGYLQFSLPKNIKEILSLRMQLVLYSTGLSFWVEKVGITNDNTHPLAGELHEYPGGPFELESALHDLIYIGPLEMKDLLFDIKTENNFLYYKFNLEPGNEAFTRLDLWKADIVYTVDKGIKE